MQKRKKLRKIIILSIKIFIGIAAIWFLIKLGYLNKEAFKKLLIFKNIKIIFLSAFAFVLSQIIVSYRLKLLLRIINYQITFYKSLKLIFIGNFFNFIIPGSVGGDIIKSYFLEKDNEENRGRGSGVVLIDRVIGIIGLSIIAFFSIIYLLINKKLITINMQIFYWIPFFILFLFIILIILIIISNNDKIRNGIKKITIYLFSKNFFYHLFYGFGIVLKDKKKVFFTLFLSVVLNLISILGLVNLINIFTDSLQNFYVLIAVSSIILILGIIPITPGNIGWMELVGALGWSIIGEKEGANVFLYWRIISIFYSLPGIFFYFFSKDDFKK